MKGAKPKGDTIAPLMTTARVARVMSRLMDEPWDSQRARRWLRSCGALIVYRDPGPGKRKLYGTTPARFRCELTELAVELEIQEAEEGMS